MSPSNEITSSNAVILTDWAANIYAIDAELESFVFETMIYSLIYDEVLIQDEVFTMSDRIADWISEERGRKLISRLLDMGTVKILSYPAALYPTEELRDLAIDSPLLARSRYQQQHATCHENPFTPTDKQKSFYHFLDSHAVRNRRLIRQCGSLERTRSKFRELLIDVLSRKHYRPWLQSAFGDLQQKTMDEFVEYVNAPEKAVQRLKTSGLDPIFAVGDHGEPIFTRTLGYQISSLHKPEEAKAIQDLLQTTFAAPFCDNEDGIGRYSKVLREFPYLPIGEEPTSEDKGPCVEVQAKINMPLALPRLDTDFVEAIRTVRESESGKDLRASIRKLGSRANFEEQIEHWRAVSDHIASLVTRRKEFSIRAAMLSIGGDVIAGVTVATVAHQLKGQLQIGSSIEDNLLAVLPGTLGVVGRHFYHLLIHDLMKQKLRQSIEQVVDFRCTPIPIFRAEKTGEEEKV